MRCRSCGNNVTRTFIDLGMSPIANNFLEGKGTYQKEITFPLHVKTCDYCRFVQLPEIASRETLFPDDYIYFSSYSKSWLEHSKAYAEKMVKKLNLTGNDLVVEIASNDGYLLQYFKNFGIPVLGIEPALEAAAVARNKEIETIVQFFGEACATQILKTHGRAKLIVANNVLAHVPNIHDFISGFVRLLADDGFITFEFPHLLNLIKYNQFDTIYHEHYSYLSLTALAPIFKSHELKIVDVEKLKTHGGSLRITVVKMNSSIEVNELVLESLEIEKQYDPLDFNIMSKFQKKAQIIGSELNNVLQDLKKSNLIVAAYGAAAKGNTLLNYAKIDSNLISYVVDLNPSKQGKLLPGSRIPVVSEQSLRDSIPDVLLILPWNLAAEIKEQLNWLVENNTKFMRAIPRVEFF
jgi:2-polyprenyl-3-methyl-5-hydroxy-6-metoxy-1,4-benzoquinol methylase